MIVMIEPRPRLASLVVPVKHLQAPLLPIVPDTGPPLFNESQPLPLPDDPALGEAAAIIVRDLETIVDYLSTAVAQLQADVVQLQTINQQQAGEISRLQASMKLFICPCGVKVADPATEGGRLSITVEQCIRYKRCGCELGACVMESGTEA